MQQPHTRSTLPALRAGAVALGLACSAHAADADTGSAASWTLSGFGTWGAVPMRELKAVPAERIGELLAQHARADGERQ